MKRVFIIIFLLICIDSHAQVIWDIDFSNKKQFDNWESGMMRDTIVAKIGKKIGVYVRTEYSDTLLRITRSYPYTKDFNEFYMSIVNELDAPNLILDKEKKKKEKDPYERPNPEEGKEQDLADIIASGKSTMQRVWLFPDFEIDLTWNQDGIIFSYKWLEEEE